MNKAIIFGICMLVLIVGCTKQDCTSEWQEGYDTGKWMNDGYEETYSHGFQEGLQSGKSMCLSVEELIENIDIFYASDEKLEDKYIQREWWGFYHNNTDFYDMANGKYCEIAIWNFTDAMIFNRGNYYVLCE
ncbi:hypothetical protein LCGC14_1219920 [marine sediment metagenome]|uniref:Uncharacterized protein n=1 Tax=marine sediment metagenome TaxID=412755 RepID=A0A0F9LBL9_9ZZZZ